MMRRQPRRATELFPSRPNFAVRIARPSFVGRAHGSNAMYNAAANLQTCFRCAILGAACLGLNRLASSQMPVLTMPVTGGYFGQPIYGPYGPGFVNVGGSAATVPVKPAGQPVRGPLARLVLNNDTSDGAPPFALADQAGRIQRFVEPVPGIDLAAYIGQVVVVRHDTGRTILATQLELPPRPLLPVSPHASSDYSAGSGSWKHGSEQPHSWADANDATRPAYFIDDDDTTTQIISDDDSTSRSVMAQSTAENTALETDTSAGSNAALGSSEGPYSDGPMFGDPLPGESLSFESWPGGEMIGGVAACPHCGGFHGAAACDPMLDSGQGFAMPTRQQAASFCQVYAGVELNFLRLHLMENAVGKLSEKYEFSPRFVIGFEGSQTLDGRVRYWIYDRATNILGGGGVRAEFNVLDAEATQRFQAGRSDVVIAAGLRLANIDLVDDDGDAVGNNLLGMTLAADAHTPLCVFEGHRISFVYGGRLSILGGDWGGDPASDFIPAPQQDDNVMAEEIYAGVQFAASYREADVFARLAFEIQNWHSDALAQNAGSDSIGFIGPGIHVGAAF
jgi:hypothetical protein